MSEVSRWNDIKTNYIQPVGKQVKKDIMKEISGTNIVKLFNPLQTRNVPESKNNSSDTATRVSAAESKNNIILLTESMTKISDSVNKNSSLLQQSINIQTQTNIILNKMLVKLDNVNQSRSIIPDVVGVGGAKSAGKLGRWLPRIGGALAVGGAGLSAYNEYNESGIIGRAGAVGSGSLAGGLAGAWAGLKIGGAGGTLAMPGIGTAIGGLGGAVIGGYYGSKYGEQAGKSAYDYLTAPKSLDSKSIVDIKNDKPSEKEQLTYNSNSVTFNTKEFKINGIDIVSMLNRNQESNNIVNRNNQIQQQQNYSRNQGQYSFPGSHQNNQQPNFGLNQQPNDQSPYTSQNQPRGARSGLGGSGNSKNMKMVYDSFREAGFSHEAARSFTAEIGRENDFNPSLMFGNHIDPHNKKRNMGMMSWQGDRAEKLYEHMKQKGFVKEDGSIIRSQEALNEQAKFAKTEMESGALGERGKRALGILNDPNSTHQDRAVALGDDVIKWRRTDPRYAHHAQKRDSYYNQTEDFDKKKSNNPESNFGLSPLAMRNQNAIRNRDIDPELKHNMQRGVTQLYGPGYSIDVHSGGQDENRRTGSDRHNVNERGFGQAADIRIKGPDGKYLSADEMTPFAQYWLSKKHGGAGVPGSGSSSMLHLDLHKNKSPTWGYGQLSENQRKMIQSGLEGSAPKLKMSDKEFFELQQKEKAKLNTISKEDELKSNEKTNPFLKARSGQLSIPHSINSEPNFSSLLKENRNGDRYKTLTFDPDAQGIYERSIRAQKEIQRDPEGARGRAFSRIQEIPNNMGERLNNEGNAAAERSESSKTVIVPDSSRNTLNDTYDKPDESKATEKKPSDASPSRESLKEYFEDWTHN